MRICICDDEKVFLDQLINYVRDCMPYIEEHYGQISVDSFFSGEELVEVYKDRHYDIVFLDLKMKQLNGFETAKQIRLLDNEVIIIFITSLADYVFKSFEYRPFWYLIKPVTDEKFRNVFFKALAEYASANFNEYTFKTREEGVERVNISSVIYLESLSRQVKLHTLEGDYFFYASISKEEEKLSHMGFIRVHKSYLVNTLYFQRVNKSSLILKNGEVLPISERRYKAVFDYYTDYLARSAI